MERTIKVLNPTAGSKAKEVGVAIPTHDLYGKVVGFMWNH